MSEVQPSPAFPVAEYHRQAIPNYRGNKFIEALPPLVDEVTLVAGLYRGEPATDEERALTPFLRQHLIYSIPNSFLQPLSDHTILATSVSAMLRAGYLTRNPEAADFLVRIGLNVSEMKSERHRPSEESGPGMAVIGISGVGKSTAVEAVLRAYPKVIHHPALSGNLRATLQVTSIKVSCPNDGSLLTVCRNFFMRLDGLLGTNYHAMYAGKGATIEHMRDHMAVLCSIHGIGVVVIDEVQNLSRAKSGGAGALLNFFLTIRDILKVPVIVIGTEEALPFLRGSLKTARRHAGQPIFSPMRQDDEYEVFCNALFDYYYLREPLIADEAFRSYLYWLSQGIADIAIKLFALAQGRALADGQEAIEGSTLRLVYDQNMTLLHRHLDAMRAGAAVHGPEYEAALRSVGEEFSSLAGQPVPDAAAASAMRPKGGREAGGRAKAEFAAPVREGVPPTRKAELVAIARNRKAGTSVHSALVADGVIDDVGAAVLRAV